MRMPGKRSAAATLMGSRPLGWLARIPLWRGTLVLAYHRIARDPGDIEFDPGVYSATAAGFDAQLQFLATHLDIVGPEELERLGDAPGRRVVITFDDGYRDNYELALPLLRRHGLTATFFLATGFLDDPRVPWWDELAWIAKRSSRPRIDPGEWLDRPLPLDGDRKAAIAELARVYKSLDTDRTDAFLDHCANVAGTGRCAPGLAEDMWMTWEMAAELRDAGMTIGGHTVTHPVLARADVARQREEIEGCRQRMADRLGLPMPYFAYPVGLPDSFDDATKALLPEAGVRMAFSLYGGYSRRGDRDPYDVPRASVSIVMRPHDFRAVLSSPRFFARW
jgi:peptidoglycan/xylan/chitin deacetylase (PgdA/CDA1 family)